jgi:hypothetical protein
MLQLAMRRTLNSAVKRAEKATITLATKRRWKTVKESTMCPTCGVAPGKQCRGLAVLTVHVDRVTRSREVRPVSGRRAKLRTGGDGS